MKKRLIAVLVLALVLTMAFSAVGTAQKGLKYERYGPHVDEIIFPIIKDTEAQLVAFLRGDVVNLPGLTRPTDIERLKKDPNTDITMNLGFHMFYMCFNMRRDPLNDVVVRRAIAHVVDRDQIILSLFRGYMLPLSSFVPQSSPFYNDNVPKYEYNPEKAKQLLDKAGYKLDPATGVRIDPKTGKPIRQMKLLTPTYEVAPTSAEIGKMIAEAAKSIGIPVVNEPMDFPVMLEKLDYFDFDMYVLAWGLSRNPTFLYDFFHSSQDVEGGYNMPGIRNPELDKVLDQLRYVPTYEKAREYADKAQSILSSEEPYVPLYSRPYIDAWRKDKVTGYVAMDGYGAANYNNGWTTLGIRRVENGKPVEGGTIKWLLPEEPKNLNPIVETSAYSWEILGRLFDGLITINPETLEYEPWMADSWKVETWQPQPGKDATKITFHIKKGITWHDGVAFTAKDVKFTIDYLKANECPNWLSFTQEVEKVETPDIYTVVIYFKTQSYWYLSEAAGYTFLAEHIYKGVKDWKGFQPWLQKHPTKPGLTKLIGHGPFMFKEYVPGEFVRLVKNPNYFMGLDKMPKK